MGGLGNGNYWRPVQLTVDDTRRIDIRDLRKRNLLRPWTRFSYFWYESGAPTGSKYIACTERGLELHLRSLHSADPTTIPSTACTRC